MKKIIAIILSALMLFSFAACGGEKNESTPAPTQAPATPTAEPTAEPTTEPTAEPVANYTFDQTTREFATDFISMTVPADYMLLTLGELAVFASSVDENSQNAVIYMNAPIDDEAGINFAMSTEEIAEYFNTAFGENTSDVVCVKNTVGDHPVIYYSATVNLDGTVANAIACYIYSGDTLDAFSAELYDSEAFEAWNAAINGMLIGSEQLDSIFNNAE